MKAISFDISIPRYLLGKSLGGVTSAVTFGALSGLRLEEIPEPVPKPEIPTNRVKGPCRS